MRKIKIGDKLKLIELQYGENFHGHYVGDVGEVIDIQNDLPLVIVPNRKSTSKWNGSLNNKNAVIWDNLVCEYELDTVQLRKDKLNKLNGINN